jgi:hypothetical protein
MDLCLKLAGSSGVSGFFVGQMTAGIVSCIRLKPFPRVIDIFAKEDARRN